MVNTYLSSLFCSRLEQKLPRCDRQNAKDGPAQVSSIKH